MANGQLPPASIRLRAFAFSTTVLTRRRPRVDAFVKPNRQALALRLFKKTVLSMPAGARLRFAYRLSSTVGSPLSNRVAVSTEFDLGDSGERQCWRCGGI